VRALFGALARRTSHFELLAVGLECHARAPDGRAVAHSTLTLEARDSCEGSGGGGDGGGGEGGGCDASGGGGRATLRAYRQRCAAGHSGL
tara:strand:+ start:652 stop:921 length:270 start_codon:yes stop_codon:yes gene_type:complete